MSSSWFKSSNLRACVPASARRQASIWNNRTANDISLLESKGDNMKQVERLDLDKIKKHTTNVYEAVIVAAKRSRQLNEERIAKLEMMPEDDSIEVDLRKVTKVALKELAEGKIETER